MDMVVWTFFDHNVCTLFSYISVYEYMWQYVSFVFLGTINFYDRNN